MSASNNATALGAHRYIEATLELEDEHGFSRPYSLLDSCLLAPGRLLGL